MTETVSVIIMSIIGFVFYGLAFYFIFATISSFKLAMLRYKLNKKTRAEHDMYQKRHQAMRDRKELHEYMKVVSIDRDGNSLERLVCKKTGWCPSKKNYYSLEFIKQEISRQKIAEEYKMYRDLEVGILAVRYKVTRDQMESIVEDVFNIKKSYHLKRIANNTKK